MIAVKAQPLFEFVRKNCVDLSDFLSYHFEKSSIAQLTSCIDADRIAAHVKVHHIFYTIDRTIFDGMLNHVPRSKHAFLFTHEHHELNRALWRKPVGLNALAISNTEKEPMPLSMAPVAKSHESKWPPITIFSSGIDEPFSVAITLRAFIGPLMLVMLM